MYAKVYTAVLHGVEGTITGVETDLHNGLPAFHIVGLPDASVREAKERIYAALSNSGYRFPARRITVNLSPADLKKEGTHLDLPIAVGVLAAMGALRPISSKVAFLGELSLDGRLQRVNGAVPLLLALMQGGIRYVVIPEKNLAECTILKGIQIFATNHLNQLIPALEDGKIPFRDYYEEKRKGIRPGGRMDFSEVGGQQMAKRGIEIGAAGKHNLLLVGPPGAGKTMLAERVPSILPPMTVEEQLEVTKIYSAAGLLTEKHPVLSARPFRQPHHTATAVALTGGGARLKPGEFSLAHNGILFLDEIPEFSRKALEVLRQPMEQAQIYLSRAGGNTVLPADFMLIGAMNPCPCGRWGQSGKGCTCSEQQVRRYAGKISGPLMDRIDLQVPVEVITYQQIREAADFSLRRISEAESEYTSEQMAHRVFNAVQRQKKRYRSEKISFNSQLTAGQVERYCVMSPAAVRILKEAFEKNLLSARGYYKVIKIAQTISDLDNSEMISQEQMAEAIGHRCRIESSSV